MVALVPIADDNANNYLEKNNERKAERQAKQGVVFRCYKKGAAAVSASAKLPAKLVMLLASNAGNRPGPFR